MITTILRAAFVGSLLLTAGCETMGGNKEDRVEGADGEDIPAATSMKTKDPSWQVIHVVGLNRRNIDNMLYFAPDGRVRAEYTRSGVGTEGTWTVEPGQICLMLQIRGRECWPYTAPFRKDETVELTSTMGLKARVTALTDPSTMPAIQPRG